MSSAASEKKVTMKLMVNKNENKFIFAEAGQECVEFISQILSLPLSTVINILHAKGVASPSPISNLFKSVKLPNYRNLESSEVDSSVLNPRPIPAGSVTDGVVYMVMDNLDVKPMSMALIKPYAHRFIFWEEKIVQVGSQEALVILKASFETNDVLTNVFLKKTGGSKSTWCQENLCLVVLWFVLAVAVVVAKNQGKTK